MPDDMNVSSLLIWKHKALEEASKWVAGVVKVAVMFWQVWMWCSTPFQRKNCRLASDCLLSMDGFWKLESLTCQTTLLLVSCCICFVGLYTEGFFFLIWYIYIFNNVSTLLQCICLSLTDILFAIGFECRHVPVPEKCQFSWNSAGCLVHGRQCWLDGSVTPDAAWDGKRNCETSSCNCIWSHPGWKCFPFHGARQTHRKSAH